MIYLLKVFFFIYQKSIEANDENFWAQFWCEQITNIQDIFTLIPAVEIRALREEAPSNLSTLCLKIVQKIKDCSENSFLIEKNQIYGMNSNNHIKFTKSIELFLFSIELCSIADKIDAIYL